MMTAGLSVLFLVYLWKGKNQGLSRREGPGGVRAFGGGQRSIGGSIPERVDIDIYFCWHEHDLCAVAIRRAYLRFNQANMGGNHFPPPRNHLPPYAQLDLIHGRSIPRAVSLNLLAYGRGQTDTAGACFDSDGKTEEFPSIRSHGFIVSVPRRGSLLHRLKADLSA